MFSALVRLTPGIESAKSCDIINMFHNCPQADIHPNENSDCFLAPTTCVLFQILRTILKGQDEKHILGNIALQIEANPTKIRTGIFEHHNYEQNESTRSLHAQFAGQRKAHVYHFGNQILSMCKLQ